MEDEDQNEDDFFFNDEDEAAAQAEEQANEEPAEKVGNSRNIFGVRKIANPQPETITKAMA